MAGGCQTVLNEHAYCYYQHKCLTQQPAGSSPILHPSTIFKFAAESVADWIHPCVYKHKMFQPPGYLMSWVQPNLPFDSAAHSKSVDDDVEVVLESSESESLRPRRDFWKHLGQSFHF